jgi:hypothetical protein
MRQPSCRFFFHASPPKGQKPIILPEFDSLPILWNHLLRTQSYRLP